MHAAVYLSLILGCCPRIHARLSTFRGRRSSDSIVQQKQDAPYGVGSINQQLRQYDEHENSFDIQPDMSTMFTTTYEASYDPRYLQDSKMGSNDKFSTFNQYEDMEHQSNDQRTGWGSLQKRTQRLLESISTPSQDSQDIQQEYMEPQYYEQYPPESMQGHNVYDYAQTSEPFYDDIPQYQEYYTSQGEGYYDQDSYTEKPLYDQMMRQSQDDYMNEIQSDLVSSRVAKFSQGEQEKKPSKGESKGRREVQKIGKLSERFKQESSGGSSEGSEEQKSDKAAFNDRIQEFQKKFDQIRGQKSGPGIKIGSRRKPISKLFTKIIAQEEKDRPKRKKDSEKPTGEDGEKGDGKDKDKSQVKEPKKRRQPFPKGTTSEDANKKIKEELMNAHESTPEVVAVLKRYYPCLYDEQIGGGARLAMVNYIRGVQKSNPTLFGAALAAKKKLCRQLFKNIPIDIEQELKSDTPELLSLCKNCRLTGASMEACKKPEVLKKLEALKKLKVD